MIEIIDPSGRVSYRRPENDPDVLEALKTNGYTLRDFESGRDITAEIAGLRGLAPRGGDEREQQSLSGAKGHNGALTGEGEAVL